MKIFTLVFLLLSTITVFGQYHVYYNGNGNDGGYPPVDTNTYSTNDMVMVQWGDNLTKNNFILSCWNTMSDGSGINYSPDAYSSGPTLQISNSDVTLYPRWENCSQPTTENYALNFNEGQFLNNDDTFESVVVESLPPFSNEITIEAWINPSTFDVIEAHNNPIILKFYTEDVYIGLKYDGGLHKLSWNGWDAYGNTDVPANQWTHIAFVLDDNQLEAMYINGNPESFTLDGNPISLPTSDEWIIGNMTWSASPYRWHGMIDEIRIWNVARTPTQILDFYNRELSGNEQGLYVYWNFNNGLNSQILCDQKLNGSNHTGILRNMEDSDWVLGVPLQTVNVNSDYNNKIRITPNPAIDYIEISSGERIENGTYRIVNSIGIVITEGRLKSNHEQILISDLNPGMYLLQIFCYNKKQFFSKLIKQ